MNIDCDIKDGPHMGVHFLWFQNILPNLQSDYTSTIKKIKSSSQTVLEDSFHLSASHRYFVRWWDKHLKQGIDLYSLVKACIKINYLCQNLIGMVKLQTRIDISLKAHSN